MPAEVKNLPKHEMSLTIPEIFFGALLGIGAVCAIWISSSILINLFQNLY